MRRLYRKPFLKKVIVRTDFAFEVDLFSKSLPTGVSKSLLETFPISEPQKMIARELTMTPNETKEQVKEGIHWFFHAKNRQKRACLSPEFFYIEYDAYLSFENLLEDFLPILSAIFRAVPVIQIVRFGLRYIDEIELTDGNIFEWSEYLNPSLLSHLSIPKAEDQHVIRAFNNFSVTNGNMVLQMNYGMYNPDFPAVIKKKSFVLDFDAYEQGLLDYQSIETCLDTFHNSISDLFEQLITDNLRSLMGVED